MPSPIRVGAVMYDPKVSVIWEIIRRFFETEGVPIDVTFYSTYELQVSALLDDAIDIAWNSPLAWIDAQRRSGGHCRAIAMRDRPRPCQSSRGADDLITDGELRRDNFYSFVAERIDGVRLMTLAEMLDVVEDKVGFERMLETLDVPAYSISTPACVGRLRAREPLAQRDLAFLQTVTNRAVKVTVPGPYLLTRAMFVAEVTAELYPTKEDLAEDVVALLRDEVLALARQGADFIQLDEPVLSELAFAPARYADVHVRGSRGSKGSRRGAERCCISDQQSRRDIDGVRIGVHVCRGNWSRDEGTLLEGGYRPLAPYLERLSVAQLVLEWATERAGELIAFDGKELGLGVVNPRTDFVESPAVIRRSIENALRLYAPEKIFLNPDCGFGTFSGRPVNRQEVALSKLEAMAAAARDLRGTHMWPADISTSRSASTFNGLTKW